MTSELSVTELIGELSGTELTDELSETGFVVLYLSEIIFVHFYNNLNA